MSREPTPRRLTRVPTLVLLNLLLAGVGATAAGDPGGGSTYPDPITFTHEDCVFDDYGGLSSNERWHCPVDEPGYAKLDFELEEATRVGVGITLQRVHQPHQWGVQAWIDPHQQDELIFAGGAFSDSGESDYQNTEVNVEVAGTPIFHYQDEQQSSQQEPSRTVDMLAQMPAEDFESGTHRFYLAYLRHESTVVEDPNLLLLGLDKEDTDWQITYHPQRAWFFDDRDFDVNTLQLRDDNLGNAIVDAERRHTFQDQATALWLANNNLAAGTVLSIDGPRSCTAYPTATNAYGLKMEPAPAGDYTFKIEAKADLGSDPHFRMLVVDLDVPAQDSQWPPRTFSENLDPLNEPLWALC